MNAKIVLKVANYVMTIWHVMSVIICNILKTNKIYVLKVNPNIITLISLIENLYLNILY